MIDSLDFPIAPPARRTSPARSRFTVGLRRTRLSALREAPASTPFPTVDLKTNVAASHSGSLNLLQLAEVPLLSVDDEVRLARKIKRGDQEARERMIRANLRLVVKIAHDYEHLGLPLPDLVSEGIIGLMKAVDRFKPEKGGKLSTYAALWIKQQIRRALANQGRTIRLPVYIEGTLYRLGRAEARLRETLGREATEEELANDLGLSPRRLELLRQSAARTTSLDTAIGEDKSGTLSDIVSDDATLSPDRLLAEKTDQHLLRVALGKLPERLSRILVLRFGLDGGEEHTLEEVGRKLNLTRERIRQLQNEAFRKLRLFMEEPQLCAA